MNISNFFFFLTLQYKSIFHLFFHRNFIEFSDCETDAAAVYDMYVYCDIRINAYNSLMRYYSTPIYIYYGKPPANKLNII